MPCPPPPPGSRAAQGGSGGPSGVLKKEARWGLGFHDQASAATIIVALVAGVGGAGALLVLLLYWRSQRGLRDNSAAPKAASRPFTILAGAGLGA